jgi:hypothetical protein
MRNLIFAVAIFLNIPVFGVIRILTFHYNEPDFVEIQYKTLKKFLKDDFELIVFNDAKTLENEKGIEDACGRNGIQCVRYRPEWHLNHPLNLYLKGLLQNRSVTPNWEWNAYTSIDEIARNPSVRHSHVIQYALDHFGYDHDDIVVIMDGDNFLINSLSIRALLGSNDLVMFNQKHDELGRGRRESRIAAPKGMEMPWVVFIAFNPSRLPNPYEMQFHVDELDNKIRDTGTAFYKYLKKHPYLKFEAFHWQDSGIFRSYFTDRELREMGFGDSLIRFIHDISPGNVQFFIFEHFMHFSAVSAETHYHQHKVVCFRKFIDEILILNRNL